LEWEKIKAYWGVVLVFLLNIFTNLKALQYSNVETVIVFRTCTTIAVAFGDYKFLGRGIPNTKTMGSLLGIVLGAIIYVLTDSTFRLESYFWIFMYFIAQCLDVLYIKHIVNSVQMTAWGRSYYNNLLALGPIIVCLAFTNEGSLLSDFLTEGIDPLTVIMVLLSCFVGLSLSITAFICRDLISATSYSVVGNMNKVLTVVINCSIWDKHATPVGLIGLFVSLVSGAAYTKFTTE